MKWPFQRKNSRTIVTTSELIEALGLQNTSSTGFPVNLSTAIGVVAVLACARVIARGLAQVPLKLFRPLPGGGKEAITQGLGRLLYRQPNEFQSAYRFRHMMGLHLALTGSFAAYINRVAGEIVELLPLPPNRVQVNGSMWEPEYKVDFGSGYRSVPASDLLYIMSDTLDGVTSMPVTQYARETIGLTMATDSHASKFFRNGGAAGGHYSTDANPKSSDRKGMIDAIKEMESYSDAAFRRPVLWNGLKYHHTSYSSEQAQLKEIRDQQTEQIAMAFGINPIMIGYSGGKTPTYASAEQLFTAHVVYGLSPWYELVEQECDRQLLDANQKEAGWEFKHLANGLMRGSHKDRSEYYAKMRATAGVMTANEVRELEDMNPVDGGDELWQPANMVVAGQDNIDETTTQNI